MADLGAIGNYRDGGFISVGGKAITGTVFNVAGAPARRQVLCLRDVSGVTVFEKSAYSDPITGAFTMPIGDTSPRTLLAVGEPGKNALVYSGVVAV